MDKIPLPRLTVLAKLKANAISHKAAYEAAIEGYRKALADKLRQLLSDVEAGRSLSTHVHLENEPHSYLDDYEQAIGLLEMSQAETVALDTDDYRTFIMDHWSWTTSFSSSCSSYASSSSSSSSA